MNLWRNIHKMNWSTPLMLCWTQRPRFIICRSVVFSYYFQWGLNTCSNVVADSVYLKHKLYGRYVHQTFWPVEDADVNDMCIPCYEFRALYLVVECILLHIESSAIVHIWGFAQDHSEGPYNVPSTLQRAGANPSIDLISVSSCDNSSFILWCVPSVLMVVVCQSSCL